MNKSNAFLKTILAVLISTVAVNYANSQNKTAYKAPGLNIAPLLDRNNVSWDVPGPTSAESMPIGNGDIGLNVWVEKNGDLAFFIGKTDSWGSDVRGSKGLMKLGGVHVSLSPNPLTTGAPFLQTLKLHEGEILIKEGDGAELRVWVDANNPVIRVEAKSKNPVSVKVTLDNWRLGDGGDTLFNNQPNTVAWYHRNSAKADAHVANLAYGAVIKGSGLMSKDEMTLQSTASTSQLISIYPLTAQKTTVTEWKKLLNQQITKIDKLSLEQTRVAHQKWWDDFWHRSWIFFSGDDAAAKVNQGYILQRFVTAGGGRGAYPIKFNGSTFVVNNPALKQGRDKPPISVDADYRTWGGQYWFQNTRPMYWPRLKAGDFDMMMPLFKMYAKITADNAAQVKKYYNHTGSYFAETAPFWGGLRYWGPEVKEDWTGHYFTPILELSMMMLDYYEYTGDKKFAKEILLPVASAGLDFFDKHFGRDAQGKLLLDPDNSIEQFWKVHNPAPDIVGLQVITARMLALPADLTSQTLRADWKRLQSELPELPKGTRNDKQLLLPYAGEQTAKPRNGENPELYAVYPFRVYGLGKPDLQLAINSFTERKQKQKGCWVQDPIQAAQLGLTDVAKTYVSYNFQRKEPMLKFPAFWAAANDYAPDEDNGGCGEHGLQEMLMQTEGKKIMLLPAWPKEWDTEFKLHAPYNTTVQGKVKDGKLINLVVIPASRKADVVDLSATRVTGQNNKPDGKLYDFNIAKKGTMIDNATCYAWIPENVGTIRTVIVHLHGCTREGDARQMMYDVQWRELARKWHAVLLAPKFISGGNATACVNWYNPANGSEPAFLEMLDTLAARAHHPEIKTVPWALWGHSGGSMWVTGMTGKYPQRVAVAVAESCGFDISDNAEALKVPMLHHNGIQDICYMNAGIVANGRKKDALWSHAVNPVVASAMDGHQVHDLRFLAIPWMDVCLNMRLPEKAGDAKLRPMDNTQAWLADTLTKTILPEANYKGNKQAAYWFPNQVIAQKWVEYMATGNIVDKTPPPAPYDLTATYVDNKVTLKWNAAPDLESGIKTFIIYRNGKPLQTLIYPTKTAFSKQTGYQRWNDGDQPSPIPAPEMIFTDQDVIAKGDYSYQVSTVNWSDTAGAKSKAITIKTGNL